MHTTDSRSISPGRRTGGRSRGRRTAVGLAASLVMTSAALGVSVALPGPTAQAAPQDEVRGLIVSYEPGVAAAQAHGQVTAASTVPDVALKDAGSPGLGLRAVEFGEPVGAAEAQEIAGRLASSPLVRWAEPDRTVSVPDLRVADTGTLTAAAVQTAPPWGLDRIDQRSGLDEQYRYGTSGAGVDVYVVDTGVRASHRDFEGRVTDGFTAVPDGRGTGDCNGHGTHVAGTVGGSFSGAAKTATLVPVRVLDCAGTGALSDVVEGLSWVVADHEAGTPAVANLSVGGPASEALDTAVRALLQDGVTVVAAAGNESLAACGTSPARVPEVITVGASTRTDAAADFSNHGSCVDLYAPGEGILSAYNTSDTEGVYASGTSMAAPHVSGVAARILQSAPRSTPAEVAAAVSAAATAVDFAPPGSPDALLYAADDTDPPPADEPDVLVPADGERLAGDDRYATSAAISAASYARPAPVVYVASGTAFADSLSGAPVAAVAGAPLLLVRPDRVPDPVARELRELRPRRIVVLGGTGVVSSATARSLSQITGASVSRLAGADRYATSAKISAASYGSDVPVVYVAAGTGTADALAGAPVAGSPAGGPMLLVGRDHVPAVIAQELRRLSPGRVVVLGGTGVVTSRTAGELARITGASVSRLAGADRYATAAKISAASYRPDVPAVYVANGTAFADALSGAPVAGMHEVPVLLVTRDTVPPAVAQELRRLSPGRVVVLGGTGVVSERVADQLDRYAG